jgi:phosphopantetheinyl transferase (holo-ACP synthase)
MFSACSFTQAEESMVDEPRFTISSLLEGKSALVQITPVTSTGNQPQLPSQGIAGSQGLGLEIANIAALPDAEDYPQDAFYSANFTSAEMAHCMRQPMAKAAFQTLLAAKRAIVKAGAAGAPKDGYKDIEIGFDGEARPTYPGCLLSLSETGTVAAAACFWIGGLEWPAAQPAAATQAPRAAQRVIPTRIRILAVFVVLSLLVLFGLGLFKILQIALPHR